LCEKSNFSKFSKIQRHKMAISAMRARGFGEEKQKTDGIKPRDILSDSRIFFCLAGCLVRGQFPQKWQYQLVVEQDGHARRDGN
jgi:hypothetical protein